MKLAAGLMLRFPSGEVDSLRGTGADGELRLNRRSVPLSIRPWVVVQQNSN